MTRRMVAVLLVGLLAGGAGCSAPAEKHRTLAADLAKVIPPLDGTASAMWYGKQPKIVELDMIGPRYGFSFANVYVVPSLDGYDAQQLGLVDNGSSDEKVDAGPGREFLIAVAGQGHGTGESYSGEPAPLSAQLVVDGATRPLDIGGKAYFTAPGETLVVNIPASADPQLSVTDLGRTQTMGLRTGKRGGDAPEVYYPFRETRVPLIIASPAQATAIGTGYFIQLQISAMLGAYAADKGWAPPGHGWLMLTIAYVGMSSPRDDSAWSFSFDLSRDLKLTGGGVAAHPISGTVRVTQPVLALGSDYAGPTVTETVDVPDPTVDVDVSIAIKSAGVFTAADGRHPNTDKGSAGSPYKLELRTS